MSIRKRGDTYYVDIRTPSGERIRRSTETADRKAAQEYHDKLKHDLWRTAKLGDKPKHSFKEACMRYLKQEAHRADYESKERHLMWFEAKFGARDLSSITRDEILTSLPEQDQRTGKARAVSNSTRNRYLATIRAMLNDAAGPWEWLDRAPKLEDLPEPSKRIRWLAPTEAQRLLAAINTDWMRDATEFGFMSGLRQANILGLEWSQVDLAKRRVWIHPDQAKARKPIGVPLNDTAVAVIRRQLGKHQTRVFTRNGKLLDEWDAAQWKAACQRAGIENFRFHDVRHTWASWHVQQGTPLNRLMELGGWASYEMVLRYAHLAPDHLAVHADALGTIWSQPTPDLVGAGNKKVG
jgi:integrase